MQTQRALLDAVGANDKGFWYEVVDTMNEGLLLVGPEREIVFLNKRAEEIVGRRLEEVKGRRCVDAINCPQCECRCRLFQDGRADNVEVSIFGDDGQQRILLKNARLIHDAKGQVLGGVETFTEITKEVQQRHVNEDHAALLFAHKCRINALMESMTEGVLALNAQSHVEMCSKRAAELLGLADCELAVGQPLTDLLGVDTSFFADADNEEAGEKCYQLLLPETHKDVQLRLCRIGPGSEERLAILHPAEAQPPERPAIVGDRTFQGIVSRAPSMHRIFGLIESAATTESNILISGESGVGKELVARAVHRLSLRRNHPFYAVNCATFTGSLLLSELFGHERGAFTGAYQTTKGKLELAGGGTLFLDEVAEIPLHYQAVLLRVLEERQFERVGGQGPIRMRARVIAATNGKLEEAVRTGRFRDDLYFRLKVIPIDVPPLRERREDVELLIQHFTRHPAINVNGKELEFSDRVIELLTDYPWPGNVRELRNIVEYLCFAANQRVDLSDLPKEFLRNQNHESLSDQQSQLQAQEGTTALPTKMRRNDDVDERKRILEALEACHYKRQQAADRLGMNRSTLWRTMKRLGID